jgi:hypothetical protein
MTRTVAGDRRAAPTAPTARPAVPALPATRGTVVAVVGPREDALPVAAALSDHYGADTDHAVIVTAKPGRGGQGPRRMHRLADVAAARREWRRRSTPTVVIVDTPFGATAWAGDALRALEPTMEWGVVDATRKIEDVAHWVRGLGGLDALAVHGLDNTVSPAGILQIGLPVGLLDGALATPERWSAILARGESPAPLEVAR